MSISASTTTPCDTGIKGWTNPLKDNGFERLKEDKNVIMQISNDGLDAEYAKKGKEWTIQQ